jgi:hypothetical protein
VNSQSEDRQVAWGCVLGIVMLAYGAVQIYAGYVGIEDAYSKGWAIAALIGAFALRFMLPLTWGAFLCASDIWD